jgi:hypothetical protein
MKKGVERFGRLPVPTKGSNTIVPGLACNTYYQKVSH